MPFCSQPDDQLHKIFLRHRRAASRRPIHAAADMKKNRASCARHWRIGVVTNLHQPVISEIARAHFFVCVIIRRIFRIDHDVPIVVRRARVIAPNVCFRHLSIWIVAAGRQLRFVSENLTDLENARRRFRGWSGFWLRAAPAPRRRLSLPPGD